MFGSFTDYNWYKVLLIVIQVFETFALMKDILLTVIQGHINVIKDILTVVKVFEAVTL